MTAKELKEKAKVDRTELTALPRHEYHFTEDEFNEFCKQHAKEQSENCAKSLGIRSEVFIYPKDYNIFKKIILNAPEPKI